MNIDDFKKLAMESIVRTGPNEVDYSSSLLFYAPGAEKFYKNIQTSDELLYKDLVTDPEVEFLREIAPSLAKEFSGAVSFYDLGPGTEYVKQQLLFDAFSKNNIRFTNYVAIDVNQTMAEDACNTVRGFSPKTSCSTIIDSFENLANYPIKPGTDANSSVAYLGLTFINYFFDDACQIINDCLQETSSRVYVAIQPREYTPKGVYEYYSKGALALINHKLSLLGLKPSDYTIETTESVESFATITNTDSCTSPIIRTGDRLLVMRSLRYALDNVKTKLREKYQRKFYDNGKFVGVLLKRK